jgi:hypothetical protein
MITKTSTIDKLDWILKEQPSQVKGEMWWLGVVAHVYNHGYLGGRDLDDGSLRPVRANSQTPSQPIS